MLGRKSRPAIGKLTGALGSGNRVTPGFSDVMTSPRSPLELRIQSPRGLKNYDLGGVGLGIVAALERSSDVSSIQVKRTSVSGLNLNRSSPIPVNSDNKSARVGVGIEEMEMDYSFEDYTYVTCHGPNNSSSTKVYFDGVNQYAASEHQRNKIGVGAFHISAEQLEEDITAFPTADFLSSCHLCQKKLHGKDIYMYRGEKAFCSTECRYRQIVVDEKKEQQQYSCERSTTTSADISSSPYTTNGQIFSTGILAI